MKLTIRLDSREFERAFRRLGEGKGVSRAGNKGANAGGKVLRGELAGILQSIAAAPKTAYRIRARAAHESQRDPAYRIFANRKIPISQLRAAAREFVKKQGSKTVGELSLEIDGDKVRFKAARKVGVGKDAKFELLKAGRLPERKVGGVIIGERRIRSKSSFKAATRKAEVAGLKALEKALEAELEKAIKRMR